MAGERPIPFRSRRQARECALQFLFGLDFTAYDWREVIGEFWEDRPARQQVRVYAEYLIQGVMDHWTELDAEIKAALDRWSFDRVNRIERNILRVALFEMRHAADVPEAAALDEAIEVAKRFGSDEAPRFVNGVLDRLRSDAAEHARPATEQEA